MKKNTITLAYSFLFTFYLSAQNIKFENVTRNGFKGVQKIENGSYYFQYTESPKKGDKYNTNKLHIMVVDSALIQKSDILLNITTSDELEDVAVSKEKVFCVYKNTMRRTRTFKVFDLKGTELKSFILNKLSLGALYQSANLLIDKNGQLLAFTPQKDKKIGYSVEKYTDELVLLYSSMQIPEKGRITPIDVLLEGEKIWVLEFKEKSYSDFFEYNLKCLSTDSGKVVNSFYLANEPKSQYGYPSFIKLTKDGSIALGGIYFDVNKEKEANSDGFFFAKTNADNTLTQNYYDWKTVSDQVKTANTSTMFSGKTKTFIQDVEILDNGGVTLISENFRKGDALLAGKNNENAMAIATKFGGKSDDKTAVTVSEFVLFDFNTEGKLTNIRKTEKPYTITEINPTEDPNDKIFVGQMRGLNLANILNNKGFFPYQFTTTVKNKKYMVYYYKYERIPSEKLYVTPLDFTSTDTASIDITSAELAYLLSIKKKPSSFGGFGALTASLKGGKSADYNFRNEYELKGSDEPNNFRSKRENTRVIKSNVNGKILIFDFVPDETNNTSSFYGNWRNQLNGKLELKYVDLPVK